MSLPATHHYIDAFMAAVPTAKQAAYRQHVTEMAPLFKQHGALQVVECWGDDIPEGKLTSMPMAVQDTTFIIRRYIHSGEEGSKTAA